MNPILQLLLNGGQRILQSPFAKEVGKQTAIGAGIGAASGLYDRFKLPGSQRDPNYPAVPSTKEDLTNLGFGAMNATSLIGLPFLAMNPVLNQSAEEKQQRTAKAANAKDRLYKTNESYLSDQDEGEFAKLVSDRQKAIIDYQANLRSKGYSAAKIHQMTRTSFNDSTPGDVLRGNPNWNAKFPENFRANQVVPNERYLIKNPNMTRITENR
jgi:hypothetical protein